MLLVAMNNYVSIKSIAIENKRSSIIKQNASKPDQKAIMYCIRCSNYVQKTEISADCEGFCI